MINLFKKKRWGGKYRVVQATSELGVIYYTVEIACVNHCNSIFKRYWDGLGSHHPTESEAVDAADTFYAAYLKSQTTEKVIAQ